MTEEDTEQLVELCELTRDSCLEVSIRAKH
jgi:hypothetical protein